MVYMMSFEQRLQCLMGEYGKPSSLQLDTITSQDDGIGVGRVMRPRICDTVDSYTECV